MENTLNEGKLEKSKLHIPQIKSGEQPKVNFAGVLLYPHIFTKKSIHFINDFSLCFSALFATDVNIFFLGRNFGEFISFFNEYRGCLLPRNVSIIFNSKSSCKF
ncbi:MAG: hypothetical protein K1000chlam2_00091 [Chlamydiae bacterium]|nr:hypothetical protein [Chlamydiota bacterium]